VGSHLPYSSETDDSEPDTSSSATSTIESDRGQSSVLAPSVQRTEGGSVSGPGPTSAGPDTLTQHEEYYGAEINTPGDVARLQRLEQSNTLETVCGWADEGIPIEAMGTPSKMEAYRQRKGTPVPWNAEQRNERSVQRSTRAAEDSSPAGETAVPDSVRNVVSSPGQSLDPAIQRAMEDRMGDSFGDVQIHNGPKAAQAAEDINARAFTVGNNIAFNSGEYDPGSAEGQHVLAHELTHVRQQTGGAVSMLPQDDVELEIDPDPKLEREAEATAQRVMQGGELGIQRMQDSEVHVQRMLPNQQPQQQPNQWPNGPYQQLANVMSQRLGQYGAMRNAWIQYVAAIDSKGESFKKQFEQRAPRMAMKRELEPNTNKRRAWSEAVGNDSHNLHQSNYGLAWSWGAFLNWVQNEVQPAEARFPSLQTEAVEESQGILPDGDRQFQYQLWDAVMGAVEGEFGGLQHDRQATQGFQALAQILSSIDPRIGPTTDAQGAVWNGLGLRTSSSAARNLDR